MDEELKKTFIKLPQCACFNLRKTTRAVTQYYDRFLIPTGLRTTQFTILAALKTLSETPLTHLAEILVMDRTTLTRNLGPLEREGMIEIRPGEDRRKRIAAITKTGEKALEKAIPLWSRAQETVIEKMGDESFHFFLKTLRSLTGEVINK